MYHDHLCTYLYKNIFFVVKNRFTNINSTITYYVHVLSLLYIDNKSHKYKTYKSMCFKYTMSDLSELRDKHCNLQIILTLSSLST